ncbi:hypothetical protein OUZ56_026153 [Daphnia magna]|uniref:Uncharacterized protein n=1 Tax=Daphnia magna TaxID=35525 RepID=A0ABQ9ZLX7_9CRUS|nr:hypothetical protein OUZ56_026153 [Daphnia magna]
MRDESDAVKRDQCTPHVKNFPSHFLFSHLHNVATWLKTTKLPRRSNSTPSRARQAARHLQRRISERERERQIARALLIEERKEEARRRLIEERTREAQRIYQELRSRTSQQQPHRAENRTPIEEQEEQEEFILQLAIEPYDNPVSTSWAGANSEKIPNPKSEHPTPKIPNPNIRPRKFKIRTSDSEISDSEQPTSHPTPINPPLNFHILNSAFLIALSATDLIKFRNPSQSLLDHAPRKAS